MQLLTGVLAALLMWQAGAATSGATIRGRVLDADGLPMPDV